MYEFLKDKAILEIELTTECTSVDIPDFIKVIKEVTDDEAYRNYSIAHGDVEHWGRWKSANEIIKAITNC